MKTLALVLFACSLFALAGCGDTKTKTTTDKRGTTDTNVPADNANDKGMTDDSHTTHPASTDDPVSTKTDAHTASTDANQQDLPAGVKEKPADELPKTDSGDKGGQ